MSFFSNLIGDFGEVLGDSLNYITDPFQTGYGEVFKGLGDVAEEFSDNYGDMVMAATAAYGAGSVGAGATGSEFGSTAMLDSTAMGSGIDVGTVAAPSSGGLGSGVSNSLSLTSAESVGGSGLLSSVGDYATYDNFQKGMGLIEAAQGQPQPQMQLKNNLRGARSYETPVAPTAEKTYGGLI